MERINRDRKGIIEIRPLEACYIFIIGPVSICMRLSIASLGRIYSLLFWHQYGMTDEILVDLRITNINVHCSIAIVILRFFSKSMNPFEKIIWDVWMPYLRTAIR